MWFRAKRYGYGWYPCSWQGWGVLFLFIISVILHTYNATNIAKSPVDIILGVTAPIFIDVAFLTIIAWSTGEKASWRWGK